MCVTEGLDLSAMNRQEQGNQTKEDLKGRTCSDEFWRTDKIYQNRREKKENHHETRSYELRTVKAQDRQGKEAHCL